MRTVTRFLPEVLNSLVLLLWGFGILWLAGSARLPSYLHPSLQPFTVAAGIMLVLLSGFSIMRLNSIRRNSDHSCCCYHDHHPTDHQTHGAHAHWEHGGGIATRIAKTAVLVVPIVVLLSGNADRYTSTIVANRGVVQDLANLPAANVSAQKSVGEQSDASSPQKVIYHAEPEASPRARNGGPMPVQVIDMLYALQMPTYREEFEGKEVEMIAQYVPMTTGNPKGDRFQAVRMFITCCAADAKPVGVTVQSTSIPKIAEMGWIKVTGKPTFPMVGGKRAAILEASKVEPCDAPPEPFVY